MKVSSLQTSDLGGDLRLDAKFHCSEAKVILRKLARAKASTASLADVADFDMPPRFARPYVATEDHGAPYATASACMYLDPRMVPSFVSTSNLDHQKRLRLRYGSLLMTCSGDVGETIAVGRRLEGMIASHDLIRIEASSDDNPWGFLWAYLSTPFAKTLVKQGTWGQVVPHIDTKQVSTLPIVRINASLKRDVHRRVEKAIALRDEAVSTLRALSRRIEEIVGWPANPQYVHDNAVAWGTVSATSLGTRRLDAFYHVGWAAEARKLLRKSATKSVSDLDCSVYLAPRLTREYGDSGIPYLSGSDLFKSRVAARQRILASPNDLEEYTVPVGTLLLQDKGQRYGIVGHPWLADSRTENHVISHNLLRIRPPTTAIGGYLYALFSSDFGRRLLLSTTCGTQIPFMDVRLVRDLEVPSLPEMTEIGREAITAWHATVDAQRQETDAIDILQRAIQEEF